MAFDPAAFVKNLTPRPGVYCMHNEAGQVIYVGKAKNLKRRVASYFSRAQADSPKTRVMVRQIRHIEVTVTHTENEALILENNLIKTCKPRYNIYFRDDKSYPYLYLSTEHGFPLFRYHRGALSGKGRYFGPYPNSGSVRQTLNLLQKLFQVRSCEDSVFANRSRPCLQYQIKRCSAPCVDYISSQDYARDIRHAVLFLEGKNEAVIKALTRPMQGAAERLEFELAARFRDQIRALRDIQEKQHRAAGGGDMDIISCAVVGNQACIQRVFIRGGLNLGSRGYFPQHIEEQGEADLIRAFLGQYYLARGRRPGASEIIISHAFAGLELMQAVFSEQFDKKIRIKTQVRGERARWLKMALDNAALTLKQRQAANRNQQRRMADLQKLLGVKDDIEQLECFDISHSQGEAVTGSCVVFGRDGPLNAKYRQFNIENVTRGDDYAAMNQVVRRRYTRQVRENARLPDLIVIDGGKGQIEVATAALGELQLGHIPVLGVAKGPARKAGQEKLILAYDNNTLRLGTDAPALHLLQHIRDEAHRFAITAHRQRRKKKRGRSRLEEIAGIGHKRRQNLIRHFGGLQGVAKAGVDDLAMAPGISKSLARKIYDVFHNRS